jgi:tape measure domain-containing protein
MATAGQLVVNLTANTQQFMSGLATASAAVSSFASSVTSRFAAVAGAASITALAGYGVKLAADNEMAAASFTTLLGSAERARAVLESIRQYAETTPYEAPDVSDSLRTLISFGVEARPGLQIIRQLGDVAGGSSARLNSLALAIGQVSSAGRLQGQDLLQLVNAGWNPLQQIAARTGESMIDLRARMSAGGIAAREVLQALDAVTAAGGRFNNGAANGGRTLAGQWSTLRDAVGGVQRVIGQLLIEGLGLGDWTRDATTWLQSMEQWLRRNADTIVELISVLNACARAGISVAGVFVDVAGHLARLAAPLAALGLGTVSAQFEIFGATIDRESNTVATFTSSAILAADAIEDDFRAQLAAATTDAQRLSLALTALSAIDAQRMPATMAYGQRQNVEQLLSVKPLTDLQKDVAPLNRLLAETEQKLQAGQIAATTWATITDGARAAIGDLVGINAEITKLNEKIAETRDPRGEPQRKAAKFAADGALPEQVQQLLQAMQQLERAEGLAKLHRDARSLQTDLALARGEITGFDASVRSMAQELTGVNTQEIQALARLKLDVSFAQQIQQLKTDLDLATGAVTEFEAARRKALAGGATNAQAEEIKALTERNKLAKEAADREQDLRKKMDEWASKTETVQQKLLKDIQQINQARLEGIITAQKAEEFAAKAREEAAKSTKESKADDSPKAISAIQKGSQQALATILRGRNPQQEETNKLLSAGNALLQRLPAEIGREVSKGTPPTATVAATEIVFEVVDV